MWLGEETPLKSGQSNFLMKIRYPTKSMNISH
jgi:hypothetical protein